MGESYITDVYVGKYVLVQLLIKCRTYCREEFYITEVTE